MPQGKHNVDDGMPKVQSDKYKLVRREINNTYEYQVVTLQKYQQIEAQVRKKSKAAEVEIALQAEEQLYKDKIAKLTKNHKDNVQKILNSSKTEAEKKKEIKALEAKLAKDRANARKDYAKLEAKLQKIEADNAKKAHEIAVQYAETEYRSATVRKKKLLAEERANLAKLHLETLKAEKDENDLEIKNLEDLIAAKTAAGENTASLEKKLNAVKKKGQGIAEQTAKVEADRAKSLEESLKWERSIVDAEIEAAKSSGKGAQSLKKRLEEELEAAEKERDELIFKIETDTKLGIDTSEAEERLKIVSEKIGEDVADGGKGLAAQLERVNEEAHKQRMHQITSQNKQDLARNKLQDKEADYEQNKIDKEAQNQADWQWFQSEKGQQETRDKALTAAVNKMASAVTDAIDNNLKSFYEYQAHIEARLQGSDISYKEALREVRNNIGISGVVSQKKVIENIKELADKGIAYNLELRAFLGTVADSIANTFDAFDASLLRIIRLQQADTTAARLGMEASLTKLFNEYFSDTSYLSDVFDSVSQTILDASSQLARDQSLAFEYMVQKWLGSLYSLGFSQETLQTIAQGITYLGTGNVQELTGNTSLNNLMAMAATRVGLDYGEILVDGLDSEKTNKLLKSIIEYLQSIANNTDNNQVVKAAYTDVFGLNMTDLRAIQSLSEGDIQNIYNKSLEYDQMMKETNSQMVQMITRVPFAQMIDTAFENAMAGASTAIGDIPGLYATWKVLSVVEDLTGGIEIPDIHVMGSGVALNTTVVKLAKLGIGGLGLMGSLLGSLLSGGLFGTFDINQWDWDEYTSRGSATKGITRGSVSDISESQEMSMNGSASADDVKQTSLADGEDSAQEDSKITNKNTQQYADIYEKIYAALADDDTTVLKEAIKTNELLEENRIFKSSIDGLDSLLDPHHIFYTSIVTYAMGQPVFGPAESEQKLPADEDSSTTGKDTLGTPNKNSTTLIADLITTTNELLKLDRIFNTSSDVDLTTITHALDTATNSVVASLDSLTDSKSEETRPLLQSLFDLFTASTVEGNVAAILEKLSSDTALNVTTVIPPITTDELTTLIGTTRVFRVDTSATNLDNFSSTLHDVQNSIEETNNSTQDVIDAAEALTNSSVNSSQQSFSTAVENTTAQSQVTSTDVIAQQTVMSNSMVDNITSLVKSVEEWEMLVAKAEASQSAASESQKVILPSSFETSLTNVSADVKKQLESVIKEAFITALMGSMQSSNSEEETSLTSILQSALRSIDVRVTNDFFDETLQKIAFTN